MDPEVQQLDAIRQAMHDRFKGPAAVDRLVQLDSHMATVRMIIEALLEESTRMDDYE